MIRPLIAAFAALSLSACAQGAASIQPVSMGNAFAGMSCGQAQSMLGTERVTLAALTKKQQGAVLGDAIGVFLILVPVSSLTGGDNAGDLAASKGKVLALESRLATC